MKKIYLAATALLLTCTAFGQSQRLVFAEEFTNASCPPCAAQNPAFNALLFDNSSKVVSLKYQTNWPGVDPMNAQTQTMVQPRVNYYSVTGVPYSTIDGSAPTGSSYVGAPANWTQQKIDTRYAVASPFTMNLTHTMSANFDSIYIELEIECTQAATGSLVAHVAVVEEEIVFCTAPGTNGEKDFYGVMRSMLPNANGTPISNSWTVGQTQSLSFSAAVPSYVYDLNQIAVVAFIQNNTNKEVLQSALSEPIIVPLDASVRECGSTSLSCAASYSPSVTLVNRGTDDITSADLTYSMNAGTPAVYNWTGVLASGSSTVITLPNVTVNNGNNLFTCDLTAVNGTTDFIPVNDNYSATIKASLSTPTPAPVVQQFVPTTFPPADWVLINGGGSVSYTRIGIGFGGLTGSMKMDFYNSPPGDVEEMITQKIDMSAMSTAELTFMLSKASYTPYSDTLDILVSADCGTTWTSVYRLYDPALTTAGAVNTGPFSPANPTVPSQWRMETVDLSAYIGQPEVMINFRAIAGYGNNMYIDDINVNSVTGIAENTLSQSVSVFPVPTSGSLNINTENLKSSEYTLTISDISGKIIAVFPEIKNEGNMMNVDLSRYENGTYFVKLETAGEQILKKVVLNK